MKVSFVQRRERAANGHQRVPVYASQWYYDSVNRMFYEKRIPAYAVPEDEFNSRFYLRFVDPDDRDDHDAAAVIKNIKAAEVHGRIWEPDNPANVIERDGLRLVNAKEEYYDALNKRRAKQAEWQAA